MADFASHFLGVTPPEPTVRENAAIPLDLMNALRGTPPGRLWRSEHDNHTLDRIRTVLDGAAPAPSDAARRSRAVLQAYCHARFEPANRTLVSTLGWATDAFVPAPAPGSASEAPADLAPLDHLWGVPSADVTRELLIAVLASLT